MKFSISQLIRYVHDNKGMVFIEEKYQTFEMLKDIQKSKGENHKFTLVYANSITALHLTK